MTAVLKHELKNYFHSLTAYIFGAFLLIVIGIGAMMYNISAAISNFEYVLGFGSMVFIVIVPILTMRTIAEEKKQKTDQLLYCLPITTTDVILGKYTALLIVFLLPLMVVCIYPLVFMKFGAVHLLTAYGSIFAFFLAGAALLALGTFISSLTDNQGFAAGIGIAVILFNYYSVSLAENVSSTSFGSLIVILVFFVFIGMIINNLTRNKNVSYLVSLILMIVTVLIYMKNSLLFEGLVPDIMRKLSIFDRLDIFVNGVFDIESVVYFITFTVFFLFLSVQSLEKRRYN